MTDTGWLVVYCSPCCEPEVAEKLGDQGFDTYHPTRVEERRHRRSREVKEVSLSLFPRYAFVREFPDTQLSWHALRSTPGVESLLIVNGRPAVVSNDVISHIRRRQDAGHFDTRVVGASPLYKGQRVKIAEGPFGGKLATVDAAKPGRSVRVLMTVFGRANYAHVPVDALRLVA